MGNPARRVGWISQHGHRLGDPDQTGIMRCPESGYRYQETSPEVLACLDIDEEAPLPAELSRGTRSYQDFKEAQTNECSVARS